MEDIKQYGDLTEKELYEFLEEIKSGDEDIQEAQAEATENIALEEECSTLTEEQENRSIEAKYGDKLAWVGLGPNNCQGVELFGPEGQRKVRLAGVKAIKQRSLSLKEKRINIQREAFRQEYIRISDSIGNEKIKLLITLLTKEHTRMIDKYTAFINARLTTLLNPLIPRRLRLCKTLYPNSVVSCPGFFYKASKEFGDGLTFWAMPNIAYFFAQNTEQKALMENNKALFLVKVDQAIKLRHQHCVKRADKELKYASQIYQKGVNTYFDLLRLNPFWFEILYNDIKDKLQDII